MKTLFKNVSLTGVIRPGEVYTFTEDDDRGCGIDCLEYMYIIRSDDEIAPALDMEMFTILNDFYNFTTFLGHEKLSDDCHRFRVKAIPKSERKHIVYCFYLQRIMTFPE